MLNTKGQQYIEFGFIGTKILPCLECFDGSNVQIAIMKTPE